MFWHAFIFCEFGHSNLITFNKELLYIRQFTPDSFPPFFPNPVCFLEISLGRAAALYGTWRRRRQDKHAGALVKLRQRGFLTPLPSIHLVNLCYLPNKIDKLLLLNGLNKDFSHSAALWLSESNPDNGLHLPGFHLHCTDPVTELSGKTKGSGICFYINKGWCTDVTILSKYCSPNLESFSLNCKPFYSPQKFSSFILVGRRTANPSRSINQIGRNTYRLAVHNPWGL